MKLSSVALILLGCLVLFPGALLAAPPEFLWTEPTMTSVNYTVHGTFASVLGDLRNDRMSSERLYASEGSIDGFGIGIQAEIAVKVFVGGVDAQDAILLKGFAGFPGFFPGVSPTQSTVYSVPSRLQAPNFIYLPYNGKDNRVRYVLTDYTISDAIPDWGSPSPGATTAVSFTPMGSVSTITWNYRKQVRVTVSTSGEDAPLRTYDVKGDTQAGSEVVNLESTTGLTPGMTVYGNGILSGTTISAVGAETVTLSAPAAYSHGRNFPGVGERLTFAPIPVAASADPRECPGSDPSGCVALGGGAAGSGVNYYDAGDSSSVSLVTMQSFTDLGGTLRTLTQVVVEGGGSSAPVQLLINPRKTLTTIGMRTPMSVEWRYDPTMIFKIGKPIDPVAVPSGKTVDLSKKPVLTILAADPALPGDVVDNAFVWAWDSSVPGSQRMKYFPIHPVDSFKASWTCTDGTKFEETGRAAWHDVQRHIVGAPANLQPPDAVNTFNSVSYTANGATATLAEFNAPSPGYSVLRFATPPVNPDLKTGAAFIVVKSEEKPGNDELAEIGWKVGTKISDTSHYDPESGKTGYLFYDGGRYDGSGPDKAYDRGTRKGAIIPVNVSLPGDQAPLVVIWYEKGQGNIGWPVKPVRYKAVWPDAPAITIGAGVPVSPTNRPRAVVYNQPDTKQPGFNPNEEHALLSGDTLYALRDDLNAVNNLSEPYALLKYYNATAGEWMMDVYRVKRPSSFTYAVEAGSPITAPLPPSFQIPLLSGIKMDQDGSEAGGAWHLRDHKGGHWAKAANWKSGDAVPDADRSRFVMQWYYSMRADFYWPFTGSLAKKEGDPVPFLNDGKGLDDPAVKPIDVTYVTRWPDTVPCLPVGETLTGARNGLPDLYHFMSAEVIFDENAYKGNGPLAKLYAPERSLYSTGTGSTLTLPAQIKTETGPGGVLTFPDLPFAVQARLFYDPAGKRLGFKGAWISSEGEEPWLLPNLMTAAEKNTIQAISTSATWSTAVGDLYNRARNPQAVSYPTGTSYGQNPFDPGRQYDFDKWGIRLGLRPSTTGSAASPVSLVGEKNALSAGSAKGVGYVVVAENNEPALNDAPVALHVIRVDGSPVFQGAIKAIKSKNVFDEKLTLHYTGDFGGEPEQFTFEWFYQPVSGAGPALPLPGAAQPPWQQYPAANNGAGQTDITIQGASPLTLSDNWFVARYYYRDAWPEPISLATAPAPGTPHDDPNNWSAWSGANFTEPMLALGWVKRVVDGLNPLEARVTDFRNNAANTTVSMLSQFGARYEGDIALNSGADNLNNLGLIAAYETVLNRARAFSIDAAPPQDYGPTGDALLNISSRLATFYLALGNEAYADAVDPTIGFSTKSAEYGNMAPSVFAFQNQLDSLLDEELVLLRGRDDTATTARNAPYYNRLVWNFTQGEGEVAYAQNYNVTDQDGSGVINAADARIMYPQGHGDAWGHYLQAIDYYYKLLGHPYFTWQPRVEYVIVAGNPIMVDYLDERKFASIAAARAKAGADILDLTYRKFYTDDPAGQWQGYKDSYADRAWGVDEWAHRAGQGAYFDWITANAILPEEIPAVALDRKRYVQDASGAFTEEIIPGADIQQINRSKVPELNSIASHFHSIQARMTEVDNGVNPLGLAKGVVPFDIDPAAISAGNTHFEQIYERAEKALENAVAVYDYANGYTQRLRQNQDTLEQFKSNLADQERDYKNRLIEIFGYPYPEDIGAGKTYPDGYDGPDIWHFNYVDRTELSSSGTGSSYTIYKETNVTNADSMIFLMGFNFTSEGRTVKFNIDPENHWIVKPSEWTMKRRAPGKIQQALSRLQDARARYDKSLQLFDSMVGDVESAKDDLVKRQNIVSSQIIAKEAGNLQGIAFDIAIAVAHNVSVTQKALSESLSDAEESAVESIPKVVGMASDVTAPIRGAVAVNATVAKASFEAAAAVADIWEFSLDRTKQRIEKGIELSIDKSEANYALNQQLAALKNMFTAVDQQLLETYLLKETVLQAAGEYQATLAEGLRLLDERMEKRAQAAAEVQEYRFQDLGFRVFRNDAIQKYRAQFDLAAKYVYLAATAYDYETNLLGADSGSGRKFLSGIARQSSLGVFSNGKPMAGFPGLADIMARLSQNFAVYKTQLGFNNPQTETTPFSLRTGLFRIKSDASSNLAWQDVLKDHRVDDLWKIPAFKRFCRPFAPESAGPQPGIVIPFPTTITYGENFFGWPLSGGDSAYSSSNFSTRVRSAGVWFQNYNSAGLSSTPRVYLVPAGVDILRSPTGDGFATREWQVQDQILPVPFPVGDTDMKDPDFIPANDSLSGEFAGIRRLADFRAYPYSGAFNTSEATSDSRLIGRSVWNTQWMLIIPGSTLLFNKDAGLNAFINSVDDIKMFFQTYSYSGN